MKKILCLVDFSEVANVAIEYAANIAKNSDAELVLLHVMGAPTYAEAVSATINGTETLQSKVTGNDVKLGATCNVVRDEFNIRCHPFVKSDALFIKRGIEEEIEAGNYDLIVMGSDGAETLKQLFFGTHSNRLIKKTSVPLLIIPVGYKYKKPTKIVYATDYEPEDAIALRTAISFTNSFEPTITLIHVTDKSKSESAIVLNSLKNLLEAEMQKPKIIFEQIIDKDIVSGINSFMVKDDQDMLVLLSKNYTLPEKLFYDNLIKEVNNIATYPLLVIHAPIQKEHIRFISRNGVF